MVNASLPLVKSLPAKREELDQRKSTTDLGRMIIRPYDSNYGRMIIPPYTPLCTTCPFTIV